MFLPLKYMIGQKNLRLLRCERKNLGLLRCASRRKRADPPRQLLFSSPPPAINLSVRPSSFINQDVFSALVSPRARRSPQTQRLVRSLNKDLPAGIEGTPVATETSRNHHLFAIRRQSPRQSPLSIHGTRVGLSRYRATVSLL